MPKPPRRDRSSINQKQARYFDKVVALFDQRQPRHVMQRLERIVSCAWIRHGETVLDVGAGVGVLVPLVKARGARRILACELSEKMLGRLKQRFPEVETMLADICDLGLPDGCMDVILMNAVFPNIVDKESALRNSARMLRAGGRLIISHPEGRSFVDNLREHLPFPLDPLPTPQQLRKMLSRLPLTLSHFEDHPDLYVALIVKEAEALGDTNAADEG